MGRRRPARRHPPGVSARTAIVVGAGIVGLACAFELLKRGFSVTVVDPAPPGSGCSSGNAGAISPGSVVPLALPGAALSGLRMMLDPDAALTVRPSYLLTAAPWLWRFVRSATPERVEAVAAALGALNGQAVERHKAMMRDVGAPELIQENGQLYLYRSKAQLAKDAVAWDLRRRHGVRLDELGEADLRVLEPDVGEDYKLAMFIPHGGHCADPLRQAEAVADAIRRGGGTFLETTVERLILEGARIVGVSTPRGEQRADHVVVAAGAWSAGLLRSLGYRVPLESQRGYHVEFSAPGVSISRPLAPADRKVFLTPMNGRLRVAGSVEFAGLTRPPTRRRGDLLLDDVRAVFPSADFSKPSPYWMGHRPCLPDSLPVIGRAPRHDGLWLAFGHGHLGLTGSAPTGHLVAELVAGGRPNIDVRPYALARF
jgi:glycine/D-amino acid oxidase-like deaminating enzyme